MDYSHQRRADDGFFGLSMRGNSTRGHPDFRGNVNNTHLVGWHSRIEHTHQSGGELNATMPYKTFYAHGVVGYGHDIYYGYDHTGPLESSPWTEYNPGETAVRPGGYNAERDAHPMHSRAPSGAFASTFHPFPF